MPHAFVQTQLSPQSVLTSLERLTFRFEKITIKTQTGYLHAASGGVVVPCLVVEPYRTQRFYIEMRAKDRGVLVKIDSFVPVVKTVGVRLALAFVTRELAGCATGVAIEKANLASFIDFFELSDGEKADRLVELREDIKPYLRDVLFRQSARQVTLALDSLRPPLNWAEIYQNENPVEIEIGPGKGSFLIDQSKRHSDRNFLGIEWAGRYLKILARKISQNKAHNLRLLPGDARRVFSEWLAPASVAGVHVYFPDPWWKKRHHKNQLFTAEFASDLQKCLSAGGKMALVTDVAGLYEEVVKILDKTETLNLCQQKTYHPGSDPPPGRTNFEIKKWATENQIFEAVWQKH